MGAPAKVPATDEQFLYSTALRQSSEGRLTPESKTSPPAPPEPEPAMPPGARPPLALAPLAPPLVDTAPPTARFPFSEALPQAVTATAAAKLTLE